MTDDTNQPHPKPQPGVWRSRLAWAAWTAIEIFFFQNALASRHEHEPRAALVFSAIFVIILLGGIVRVLIQHFQLDDQPDDWTEL